LTPPDPCPLKLSNFCAIRKFLIPVNFNLPGKSRLRR